MKLSKDQKNILKGCLAGWAGMIVAIALFAIFGKRTVDLWLMLGVTIGATLVLLFLMLGSRVPKDKDENQ